MKKKEHLAPRIFVRVERDDDPFLIANTTLSGVGDGLEDGDIETVAEYKRVRVFKIQRGTVEIA